MKTTNMLKILSLVSLALFFSAGLHAQVTIGMDTAPLPGAILELRDKPTDSTDNTTASKGLGLPRVALNATATPTTDMDKGFYLSLGLSTPASITGHAAMHEGLTVYNTTSASTSSVLYHDMRICPGIYVWIGDKWKRSMSDMCHTP